MSLGDGAAFALADQGLVFAPVTAASGPLPGLPSAVCLRDLAAAEGRLTHFLRRFDYQEKVKLIAHPDRPGGGAAAARTPPPPQPRPR